MPSPHLPLRLPQDQHDAVKALADKFGVSAAVVIRICIARALPYAETYLSLKQQAHLSQP